MDMENIMGMHIPTLGENNFSNSRYGGVERRRIQQEACFSYMENAFTGVCITQDENILTCNQRFTELFGFSREELSGMPLTRLFRSDIPQPVDDLDAVHAATELHEVHEVTGRTKDGRIIWLRQTVTPLCYENKRLAISHVVDVTDQKFVEDTLRDSEKGLRLLSGKILKAQESERKRVASELHDGIGQTLSSIKFRLESTFCELSDDLRAEALIKLECTVSSIRGAIDEVRRISMDLRPPMLDDLGIEPAVTWLCREFQVTHPLIKIVREIDLQQTSVDSTLRVVMFRILQEAFNNIGKHAHATQIHVSLWASETAIALSVKDNGCGFVAGPYRETRGGYGIYSMRERATLSGGHLVLDTAVGAGTRVAVSWPYKKASHVAGGAYTIASLNSTEHHDVEGLSSFQKSKCVSSI